MPIWPRLVLTCARRPPARLLARKFDDEAAAAGAARDAVDAAPVRVGDGFDHRQAEPAAAALARTRTVGAHERSEDIGVQGGVDARSLVFDGHLYMPRRVMHGNPYLARAGVAPRVLQQRQQRLAQPGRIAVRVVFLTAGFQFQHETGGAELRVAQGRHRMHLGHHVGARAAHVQPCIVGQAQHAQVLDQARQAFDLGKQAAEL
ncbi:hypothetical protein G6F32_014471 [Rhizopus arrhizus]|nr:hypothetical protein G6F32_014471 [Rhizopus arrhizus]